MLLRRQTASTPSEFFAHSRVSAALVAAFLAAPPAFAQQAASAPAAASMLAPSERAQRDSEVFHWILIHADKPRRAPPAREEKVAVPRAKPAAKVISKPDDSRPGVVKTAPLALAEQMVDRASTESTAAESAEASRRVSSKAIEGDAASAVLVNAVVSSNAAAGATSSAAVPLAPIAPASSAPDTLPPKAATQVELGSPTTDLPTVDAIPSPTAGAKPAVQQPDIAESAQPPSSTASASESKTEQVTASSAKAELSKPADVDNGREASSSPGSAATNEKIVIETSKSSVSSDAAPDVASGNEPNAARKAETKTHSAEPASQIAAPREPQEGVKTGAVSTGAVAPIELDLPTIPASTDPSLPVNPRPAVSPLPTLDNARADAVVSVDRGSGGRGPASLSRPPVAPSSTSVAPVDDGETLVPIARSEPQFSTALMRSLHHGEVKLRFVVLPDGSVSEPEVVSSSSSLLNQAAVEALARWRFAPLRVSQSGLVELGFDLD